MAFLRSNKKADSILHTVAVYLSLRTPGRTFHSLREPGNPFIYTNLKCLRNVCQRLFDGLDFWNARSGYLDFCPDRTFHRFKAFLSVDLIFFLFRNVNRQCSKTKKCSAGLHEPYPGLKAIVSKISCLFLPIFSETYTPQE